MKTHIFQREISPNDCANAYEHLHHADIVRILEEGRLSALVHGKYPNEYFQEKGLFLVVSHLSVNYLREVKIGIVQVSVSCASFEQKKLHIEQSISNARGKFCVKAKVCIMCLNSSTGRAASLPDELLSVFAE